MIYDLLNLPFGKFSDYLNKIKITVLYKLGFFFTNNSTFYSLSSILSIFFIIKSFTLSIFYFKFNNLLVVGF